MAGSDILWKSSVCKGTISLRNAVCNDQLRTVCQSSRVAAEQAEIIGNPIVIVIQIKAQADLRQAAVGGQFVDVKFPGGQVEAVNVVDRRNDKRPVGTTIGCCQRLEVGSLQSGRTKCSALEIGHETLENRNRVATAADGALFDFEYYAEDSGVIRDGTCVEGQNAAILFPGRVIAQVEGSRCAVE